MDRRIRMIVPVPQAALAAFGSQIPPDFGMPGVSVEFACAARGGSALDSVYEGVIADAYCLEAGARAEAERSAAVCINSMSDSGVAALRSRLTIPVVGTAQSPYALAGKEDSVFPLLLDAAHQAVDEDGADVLILGSTTRHQSHAFLAERLDVPVINPDLVGYKTCEMLL